MPSEPAPENEIRRRRLDLGFTQEELASITDLSVPTIQRLEAGTAENPGIVALLALSVVLRCKVAELLDDRWKDAARVKVRWDLDPRLSEASRAELAEVAEAAQRRLDERARRRG
jgi:transcriptional regulator with XRE-family HTH domain